MHSAMLQEEESRLLKRHARKTKKPYVIQSRMPNTTIRAFTEWRSSSRYATAARREQALRVLRKGAYPCEHLLYVEYRAAEST